MEDKETSINVMQFVQARAKEIATLMKDVAPKKSNKASFQNVPFYMRRRAASQNPKRVPRKFRTTEKSQATKPSSKNKKYRPKPKSLREEYAQRSTHDRIWLENHIWFAKRFKMDLMWGYRLPIHSNDRKLGSSHFSASNRAMLQDLSYYCCIELCGPLNSLGDRLSLITDHSTGHAFLSEIFLDGSKEGHTFIYYPNSYPYRAIGPVSFLWRPLRNHSNAPHRQLWIWCHPSFHDELVSVLIEIFHLKDKIKAEDDENPFQFSCQLNLTRTRQHYRKEKFYIGEQEVSMRLLKNTLVRHRLIGPESLSVLNKVLCLASVTDRHQKSDNDDTSSTKKLELDGTESEKKLELDEDDNAKSTKLKIDDDSKRSLEKLKFDNDDDTRSVKKLKLDGTRSLKKSKLDGNDDANSVKKLMHDNDDNLSAKSKVDNGGEGSSEKLKIDDDSSSLKRKLDNNGTQSSKKLKLEANDDAKSAKKLKLDDDTRNVKKLKLHDETIQMNVLCDGTKDTFWWDWYYADEEQVELHEEKGWLWDLLKSPQNAYFVVPKSVIGLTVRDPRITMGFRNNEKEVIKEHVVSCREIEELLTPETSDSSLWEGDIRNEVTARKISDREINERRSKRIGSPDLGRMESRIPILLVHQNGLHGTGFSSGWDLIAPLGWSTEFWRSLERSGGRSAGLRDLHFVNLESGKPSFPCSFPDSAAGSAYEEKLRKDSITKHFRYPPDKRTNFSVFGTSTPFFMCWKTLVQDWIKELNEPDTAAIFADRPFSLITEEKCDSTVPHDFYVYREVGLRHLSLICENLSKLSTRREPIADDFNKINERLASFLNQASSEITKSLILVKLRNMNKGRPSIHSGVYLLSDEDIKAMADDPKFSGASEPKCKDKKKRKHKESKDTKTRLDRPVIDHLISNVSRKMIGYVSEAGFSSRCGQGFAVGHCSTVGLLVMVKKCLDAHLKPLVLLRDQHNFQYRLATIEIIENYL